MTEYLGTENGKGEHKKLFSEPNKSKINLLNHAKKKAQKLAEQVMRGDEWVLVSDETFAGFEYFFVFPLIFNQWRGEALSRGEREIRDELGSQPS